jgi:hypothetical protein
MSIPADHAGIEAAFAAAQKSKLYDAVLRITG